MKILAGILWGIAAQVLTFYQLQGQLKYQCLKDNLWLSLSLGLPISYMFMKSVGSFVSAFGGEIWPSRLIGFGVGVIVFTIMSYLLFKEPLTSKTILCLFLGCLIVAIQILWK